MNQRATVRKLGLAAVLTFLFVACGDTVFGPEATDVEFDDSLGIDLSAMTETLSGLYYQDDVVGTGDAAAAGDMVTVAYTGWLVDGDQFDSGELEVIIGVTSLIPGFAEGLIGMQVGGIRTIVIPADLGYGSVSPGAGIPANAVLVFELEVTALVPAP